LPKLTSTFAKCWNTAKVLPIPKININRYPHFHFYLKHLSGFWKNCSCMTAMLKISENISMKSDNRQVTFLTLLDYSKAFDTVDHFNLCSKLKKLNNFSSPATSLMRTYLMGRSQCVVTESETSDFLFTKRGVPQGGSLDHYCFRYM